MTCLTPISSTPISGMKKLRLLGGVVVWQLAFPHQAQAQTTAWAGVCVDTEGGNTDVATIQGFQCLLANVLSVALTLLGLVGFVMIVVASLRYLLSGGNSQNVEKSKQTISYAVIGIIVALSAFIILNLISEFTGVKSILKFSIPDSNTCWPAGTPCP